MTSLQHLPVLFRFETTNFGKIQTLLGLKRQKIVRMHKTCYASLFLRLSLARFFREGKHAILREDLANESLRN